MEKDMLIKEIITKEKVISLMDEYYSIKMREDVHFAFELGAKNTDLTVIPDVKIYLEKYIMGDRIRVYATLDDIKEVLDVYAANRECELLSFKYCGGVRKAGYYFDEDTPMFEGIAIKMKKKAKVKRRKK